MSLLEAQQQTQSILSWPWPWPYLPLARLENVVQLHAQEEEETGFLQTALIGHALSALFVLHTAVHANYLNPKSDHAIPPLKKHRQWFSITEQQIFLLSTYCVLNIVDIIRKIKILYLSSWSLQRSQNLGNHTWLFLLSHHYTQSSTNTCEFHLQPEDLSAPLLLGFPPGSLF